MFRPFLFVSGLWATAVFRRFLPNRRRMNGGMAWETERGLVMQKRVLMFATLTLLAVSTMAATGSAQRGFSVSEHFDF